MRVLLGLLALYHLAGASRSGVLDGSHRTASKLTTSSSRRNEAAPLIETSESVLSEPSRISVSWSNYAPNDRDYVALYVLRSTPSPAVARLQQQSPEQTLAGFGLDLATQAPVKYWRIKELPATAYTPGDDSGSLEADILNLRNPQVFVLVQAVKEAPPEQPLLGSPVAVSSPVTFVNPNEPTGIHIQLTGRQGEVRIMWTQGRADDDRFSPYRTSYMHALTGWDMELCTETAGPQVRWSEDPNSLVMHACASSFTYTVDEMCGAPANGQGWADVGSFHVVTLRGMQPRDRVYYTVGDPMFGMSPVLSFFVPTVTGPDVNLRFIALADQGQANLDGSLQVENWDRYFDSSVNVSAGLERELGWPHFLMHYGDISYARGYVWEWDLFLHLNRKIMTSHPWMTAIGNHERDWPGTGDRYNEGLDSGGECGVAYQRRFPMPGTTDDAPWYSFEMGPVHFTQISTEHAFDQGSPQYAWLKKDLAAVDRSRTPWIIVGGHRPMYVSSTYASGLASDQQVALDLQASVEPLLLAHKVDLVFWGHHHSLQRTCPIAKGQCDPSSRPDASGVYRNPKAPIHMIIGNAGAGFSHEVIEPQPEIFETIVFRHGYSRVSVGSRHVLNVTSVADTTGEVIDFLSIVKA